MALASYQINLTALRINYSVFYLIFPQSDFWDISSFTRGIFGQGYNGKMMLFNRLGLEWKMFFDEDWSKPLTTPPKSKPTNPKKSDGPEIKWEHIQSNGPSMWRARVPGGWLVYAEMSAPALTFYPDPKHKWDGGSLKINKKKSNKKRKGGKK